MKHNLKFNYTNNKAQAIEETKNYFLGEGFEIIEDSKNLLIFKRGSLLLNMVTFNPLKWKSIIQITFNEGEVNAQFDIDATFQTVTFKEEQLWESFIQNYQASVQHGTDFSEVNKTLIKETRISGLKYIKAMVIGAFLTCIPAAIIGYFTGFVNFIPVAAVVGGTMYMMREIEKDKKKVTG